MTNFASEVVPGKNRFVLGISVIAAIGGVLFGDDSSGSRSPRSSLWASGARQ